MMFALLKAAWKPLGILLLLVGVGTYGYYKGIEHAKPQLAAAKDEIHQLQVVAAALDAANRASAARISADTATAVSALQAARYSADSTADRRADAAIARMRSQQAALGNRTPAPANAAPATCHEYAADPRLLPERDRELLIRLGQRADRIVRERNACVAGWEAADRIFRQAVDTMSAQVKGEVF